MHRIGNGLIDLQSVHVAANLIPQAKCVELAGGDGIPYLGDADALLDMVQEFLTGAHATPDLDRSLATVLFTDIVGSTDKAGQLGDRRWGYLLDEHHARIRRLLDRFRVDEVDTAGDGFFATFDSPARSLRCAWPVAARALLLPSCAAVFTRPQGSSGIPHGREIQTPRPGRFRIWSCPGQARCRLPRSLDWLASLAGKRHIPTAIGDR